MKQCSHFTTFLEGWGFYGLLFVWQYNVLSLTVFVFGIILFSKSFFEFTTDHAYFSCQKGWLVASTNVCTGALCFGEHGQCEVSKDLENTAHDLLIAMYVKCNGTPWMPLSDVTASKFLGDKTTHRARPSYSDTLNNVVGPLRMECFNKFVHGNKTY